jgi:FkbM family methyltransferase
MPIVDVSQHGEASILAALVEDDWPRYLVDVGAHDGRSLSNSFPFIELGWPGVLVEPLPPAFALLADRYASRADVRCVQVACAERDGRMPLSVGTDGPLPMTSRLGGDSTVEVEVRTLTRVLDEAAAPADFSFLLVDAEGTDSAVLKGLDFERYRPRVIVTEDAAQDLLDERGYLLYTVVGGVNSIWIARELAAALGELPLSTEAVVERVGAAAWARRCTELERSRDEIWQRLVTLESSRSWRLTRPLRRLAERRLRYRGLSRRPPAK